MAEFVTELTQFCSEIVEVLNFDEMPVDRALEKFTAVAKQVTKMQGTEMSFKKTLLLVGTPANFSKLAPRLAKRSPVKYFSAVLDKVDLL